MRHLRPAQKGVDGPWHFVSMGRDGGHPIGYCTSDCSHASAAEAAEHYRQWMLDGFTFDGVDASAQRPCEIPAGTEKCGTWTQRLAQGPDGWALHHVCDAHADRTSIELLYPPGHLGESFES